MSTLTLAPRRQHLCLGFVTLSLRLHFCELFHNLRFLQPFFFLLWWRIVWLIGWNDFGPDFEMGKPKAFNRVAVKHFPVAQKMGILRLADQKLKKLLYFKESVMKWSQHATSPLHKWSYRFCPKINRPKAAIVPARIVPVLVVPIHNSPHSESS